MNKRFSVILYIRNFGKENDIKNILPDFVNYCRSKYLNHAFRYMSIKTKIYWCINRITIDCEL